MHVLDIGSVPIAHQGERTRCVPGSRTLARADQPEVTCDDVDMGLAVSAHAIMPSLQLVR